MADIILAGASGLTGGLAAPMLAAAGHKVQAIGRREMPQLPGEIEQIVAPADEWASQIAKRKADVAISCLGSTIKKAGSKEAFRKIDVELLRDFAAAAQQAGARHMITVSSISANSSSPSFYMRMKGDAEDALRALNFDRLDIIRPGTLIGDRQEFRFAESIAMGLSPLIDGLLLGHSLSKFRSTKGSDVAAAITALAAKAGQGESILHNRDIGAVIADATENAGG